MKKNSYEKSIWWRAEDEAYVVDVPELPGCMAHGERRQAAIKFWIKTAKDDGQTVAEPRGRYSAGGSLNAKPELIDQSAFRLDISE